MQTAPNKSNTLSEDYTKDTYSSKINIQLEVKMYATVKTLSILALAGSVLAVPVAESQLQRRGGWGEWRWGNRGSDDGAAAQSWTNWAATETVYVTPNAPAPTAAPAAPKAPEAPAAPAAPKAPEAPAAPAPAPAETTPAAAPSAPASGGQFYGKPQGGNGGNGDWSSAAPEAPAPASPSSAPSAPAPASDGSWEGIVGQWRSKMGLGALSIDSQLTANAQKTADESVGGLHHQLNSGSMAQVLAPGEADGFEHVFVGGWLCELPNTPGLDGVCAEQSKGWSYEGQTGHAEILTSGSYKKIGCALGGSTGVWSCDLA